MAEFVSVEEMQIWSKCRDAADLCLTTLVSAVSAQYGYCGKVALASKSDACTSVPCLEGKIDGTSYS